MCPTGGIIASPVIAVVGMAVIFDNPSYQPPANWMPDSIKCGKCGREYSE